MRIVLWIFLSITVSAIVGCNQSNNASTAVLHKRCTNAVSTDVDTRSVNDSGENNTQQESEENQTTYQIEIQTSASKDALEEAKKIEFVKIHKQFLVDGEYGKALAIFPELENELTKNSKNISESCIILYFCQFIPLVMLSKDEDLLRYMDDFIEKYSKHIQNDSRCHLKDDFYLHRIILLSRINRADDVISESRNWLKVPYATNFFYYYAHRFMSGAYAVKKEYVQSRFHNEASKRQVDKLKEQGYDVNTIRECLYHIKTQQYFLDTLCETHHIMFANDLPPPPVWDQENPGRIKFKLTFGLKILSNVENKVFTEDDMRKALETEAKGDDGSF